MPSKSKRTVSDDGSRRVATSPTNCTGRIAAPCVDSSADRAPISVYSMMTLQDASTPHTPPVDVLTPRIIPGAETTVPGGAPLVSTTEETATTRRALVGSPEIVTSGRI